MNCTAALIALVLGGVFEKFPRLKVVFFECSAEWILFWMHRMDDDYEWAKDFSQLTGHLSMAPSEYVKRNCYVTCEADERDLATPIRELGEDRIFLATGLSAFRLGIPAHGLGHREKNRHHRQPEGQDTGRERGGVAQPVDPVPTAQALTSPAVRCGRGRV